MDIFNLNKTAFGLDISDYSVKIFSLKQKGKRLAMASYGAKDIPRGIVERGKIVDEEKLVKILRTLTEKVKGEKIKTNYVICSLPEEEAFLRVIQLPLIKEEEVEKAIQYELESQVPFKINDIYYDYQVLNSPQSKKTNIIVAAVPKAIVESYISALKKAGMKPLGLQIESQALVTSLIKNFQISHPVVILDIGAAGTGVTIFSGSTILFTSHIFISGQDLTNAISRNLKIDFKEAEILKHRVGLNRTQKEGAVYESMVPLLTDLSEQVQKVIEFFKEHGEVDYAPDGFISKIVLCGGDSLLIGLPKFLSESLGLSVELGNPLINLGVSEGDTFPISFKESLSYTVAIGLALSGASNHYTSQ